VRDHFGRKEGSLALSAKVRDLSPALSHICHPAGVGGKGKKRGKEKSGKIASVRMIRGDW